MTHVCDGCHQSFKRKTKELNRSLKEHGKAFCTPKCARLHRPKRPSATLKCQHCGILFQRLRQAKPGSQTFCSVKCRVAATIKCRCEICGVKSRGKRCREHQWTGYIKKTKLPNPRAVVKHCRNRKLLAIEFLGGKCIRCGYNRTPRSLHFHHIDPTAKDFMISGRCMSWERMRAELIKCELLCANCHAERHEMSDSQTSAKRHDLKRRCVEYKGGACQLCTYSKCPNALHFHHTDPKLKLDRISRFRSWSADIQAELDKCVLVCANCHGEIHDGLVGPTENDPVPPSLKDSRSTN